MKKIVLMAIMGLTAAAVEARQDTWDWHMPSDVYADVDYEYRSGIDRASRIFQEAWNRRNGSSLDTIPMFRACQAEWKKVRIQCEVENYNEDVLAYCQFMQGFSFYLARDRNEAIKLFNEVLDLYKDAAWVACPAIYWRGQTYFSMGESRRGYEDMEEISDTGAYVKHPLACEANFILADRAWNSGKIEDESKAREYWERCAAAIFAESCWSPHSRAQENLTAYFFATEDYATYQERLFWGCGEKDLAERCQRILNAYNWTENQLGGWGMTYQHYRRVYKKDKEFNEKISKIRRSFAEFFDQNAPLFTEAKRDFEYAMMAIDVWRPFENEEKMLKRINTICKRVKGYGDEKVRADRFRQIAMKLCGMRKFTEARAVAEFIDNPRTRLYLQADIEGSAGDWPKVLKIVEELLANKTSYEEEKSLKNRIAGLCHHRLGDYPRAVKIYLELPDPPGTLWSIQDCYRKMGEKKKCYATLVEIQSMFPPEAPQAVYTMAKYYEADGDKTKAIALYRRLLSQPEWKQTSQSSQAHQDLERLGVATGGAMINAVR